ncbi:TonB-dependent siderophore receptor [Phenylobacterium sp. LjRoot225]|uniref:TonB-dependent siderophore receptor n=1 Tax=Phenylobacterium sp. LjRoot225 TaxID=3342285 RepID=UPI003ED0E04C
MPMAEASAEDLKPESEVEALVVYGRGATANTAATGLALTPRETPQSLSVITREQIQDQAAFRVTDVLAYTTGISVKAVDRGRNMLSARGFEITNFQIDGVPFEPGNIGLEETSTAIYERVEVVRGATGLLQGAGEPSASISLVRKHADAREFSGELSIEAGSWSHFSGTADVSAPLTKSGAVRGRFVAQVYDDGSFVDLESSQGFTLYGVIDADLGENTRLSVGASHQRDERSGVLWGQLPSFYSDGTRTDWPRSQTTAAKWNQWDTTEQTAFVTLEHSLGRRWTVRGDVSYHRQDEDSKLLWMWGDLDKQAGAGMSALPYWYNAAPEQWNLNLTVNGKYDLFGREHDLVVGAMYDRLLSGWSNRDPVSAVPDTENFHNWDGSFPEPQWGERYDTSGVGTTKQSAIYGATRLQILDQLKLIAGGRLSSWRRHEEVSQWTPLAYTIKYNNEFTPYVGLIYDLTDTLSAYASYTTIFDPQTAKDREGKYLAPLKGKTYETGLKADLMDGRLRASGAVFRIEQDNFAVVDKGYLVPGTLDPAYRTAQGTVSEGYELEVAGKLLPTWDISVGWSQFAAKDGDGVNVQAHHPRRVLRLSTKYELSGALDLLSVGGSLRWESRPPQTAVNPRTGLAEAVGQSAYVLVNLLANYDLTDRTSIQLNVNNLFDKTYYSNNAWFAGFVYGEPRNARVTLRYAF